MHVKYVPCEPIPLREGGPPFRGGGTRGVSVSH
jgi:hypothetical protein